MPSRASRTTCGRCGGSRATSATSGTRRSGKTLPDGYVQRHVLRGRLPDGDRTPIEMAACLFVTVDGEGRIARIEEYADTRGSDPLRALATAQRAARA